MAEDKFNLSKIFSSEHCVDWRDGRSYGCNELEFSRVAKLVFAHTKPGKYVSWQDVACLMHGAAADYVSRKSEYKNIEENGFVLIAYWDKGSTYFHAYVCVKFLAQCYGFAD